MERNEENRQKALSLINAYFDGKEIIMKDPAHGVHHWTNAIHNDEFWSYLGGFLENLDKYKVVEE